MDADHHSDLLADPALVDEFVAATSDATCPMCTRAMRDVEDATCPHCAAPLALSLGSVDLHRAPWIILVLGLATTLGFSAVCVFICLLVEGRNIDGKVLGFLSLNLVGAGLTAAGLTFAIRRRGWFQATTNRTQRWGAALGVAVPMLWIVVCLFYLRN